MKRKRILKDVPETAPAPPPPPAPKRRRSVVPESKADRKRRNTPMTETGETSLTATKEAPPPPPKEAPWSPPPCLIIDYDLPGECSSDERKRLCDLILGEREERRIWVEENFGDKDADEFGWVHNEQFDKVKEVTSPKRFIFNEDDPDCHEPVAIFQRLPFAFAFSTAKDFDARIKADVDDTDDDDDDDDDDLPRQWRPRQWSNVENWNTDEKKYGNLKSCAVLALDDYNQQEGTNYEFIEIQKVGWQPVSGTKYEIFFQARKSAGASGPFCSPCSESYNDGWLY